MTRLMLFFFQLFFWLTPSSSYWRALRAAVNTKTHQISILNLVNCKKKQPETTSINDKTAAVHKIRTEDFRLISTIKKSRAVYVANFMVFPSNFMLKSINEKIKMETIRSQLPLPLVGLALFGLHFFVICLFWSQEESLFCFNLSFRVIWLWALHSLHWPFSYLQAKHRNVIRKILQTFSGFKSLF